MRTREVFVSLFIRSNFVLTFKRRCPNLFQPLYEGGNSEVLSRGKDSKDWSFRFFFRTPSSSVWDLTFIN
ncbi:hypothetical protein L596_003959 [Steinernema carpocapsae]|uniref:Uncharacterized protein n=1 Tax=Steinernema carpocapsae TaxID=34508 RepID=A0A4U8UVT9_STECR|nr:hypothetical protein L596_003959 [Steinernema carpocapsae]